MYFIALDMWQYIVGSFMPIMEIRVQAYIQHTAICGDLKYIFLHLTTNTYYNCVRPDFGIIPDVALMEKSVWAWWSGYNMVH